MAEGLDVPLIIKRNVVKKYIPDFGKSKLIIPEGIVEIEKEAFEGVDTIRYVKCPSTLSKIGDWAFARCANLERIDLPADVDMGKYVFRGCQALCKENFLIIGGHLLSVAAQDPEIVLPEGVQVICQEAFDNVKNTLQSIIIPESVEVIKGGAFSKCIRLKAVHLPQQLKEIRQDTFWGCESLEDITLPAQVEKIKTGAFSECCNLTHIILPQELQEIEENAFNNCRSLLEVTVNSNVTIRPNAFKDCVSLRDFILSHGCNITIQEDAFFGCSNLPQYNGAVYIGNVLYKYVSECKEFCVPDFVTKITAGAFCGCQALESVVLPDVVDSLGEKAFQKCENLKSVRLSSRLSEIPYNCFSECLNLPEIHLPFGIKRIGIGAFSGCKSLENAILPDSVEELRSSAFFNCSQLKRVVLSCSLKSIDSSAFYNCCQLTSVEHAKSLQSIGERAFYGCSSLRSFPFEKKLRSIEKYAFEDCVSLCSVELPAGIREVSLDAFNRCNSMRSISMPDHTVLSYGHFPKSITSVEFRGAAKNSRPVNSTVLRVLSSPNSFNECESVDYIAAYRIPLNDFAPSVKLSAICGFVRYRDQYSAPIAEEYEKYILRYRKRVFDAILNKEHLSAETRGAVLAYKNSINANIPWSEFYKL